jgi:hypothetical protein
VILRSRPAATALESGAGSDARPFFAAPAMDATAINPTVSPIELEVQRIRALLKNRQFAESLQAAETLAVQVPENRDVLYLDRGEPATAEQRFPRRSRRSSGSSSIIPAFSRLYQERGHCYVVLRDAPQAIEAFLRP